MIWKCCAVMLAAVIGYADAQDYPAKNMRIVATAPGGFADVSARIIAQGLTVNHGRTVIVENRGGATFAIEMVAKASPDGYTLLLYGSSIWLLPFMRDNLPYDPLIDLTPITLTTRSPNVVLVPPTVQANSVADLIALAKARPGELNYS